MRHGLGYVHTTPSIADSAVSVSRALFVPKGFTPTRHPNFQELWGVPLDQRFSNGCVGYWAAKCWDLSQRATGENAHPKLSPLALYYWGRRHAQAKGFLADAGMHPEHVAYVINDMGVCPEHNWQCDKLTDAEFLARLSEPPDAVAVLAAKRTVSFFNRVRVLPMWASGTRITDHILHALDNGRVCGIAIPVDYKFVIGGHVLQKSVDEERTGYHEVAVLDWRVRDGEVELLLGNSWGDWGGTESPNGTQWASRQLVEQSRSHYFMQCDI